VLYVYAVRTTTAANAVLLNNTAPLYVALLSPWLLNEARPRHTWPSLALAMVGVVLVTGLTDLTPTHGEWTGIGAAVISGLTLGLTMLISRRLGKQVDGLIQGWWSTGVAALLALPLALLTPWSAVTRNLPLLVLMGVFAFGLPYLLYFFGLRRVNAQVGSLVALLEPVSGVLIGALLYQEVPSMLGGLGILLILASIYLISK
jgi:drug/metabolite transporter (DMT)-like permease